MTFIDVRCVVCHKLLCQASKDFFGLVRVKCRHCKKLNTVSLAVILKQMVDESATITTTIPVSASR